MQNQFSRNEMLIGKNNLDKLAASKVAVFGIGGVGGYVAEALVRAGVGTLDIIDSEKIDITNINRQIIATHKTVGKYKTEAAKERLLDINPQVVINTCNMFFTPENSNEFDFKNFDYVVDAIDVVTSKIELILKCKAANTPVISCMGTGNKLNPEELSVADIFNTSVCPLARVMRKELKNRGVKSLKVVYSKEEPLKLSEQPEVSGRHIPGSMVFVPAAAGLLIASQVVKDIIGK